MLLHTNARLFRSARLLSNQPLLCRHWQPTRAASANGKQPEQQRVEDDADDPVAAMLWAAQQQDGVRVVFEGEGAEELDDLEDVLEDLEDPWMRNPSRECVTCKHTSFHGCLMGHHAAASTHVSMSLPCSS